MLLMFSACSAQPPKDDLANTLVLEHGTRPIVGGMRIGIGNFQTEEFEVPGGMKRRGKAAQLSFPDGQRQLFVGRDSVFSVEMTEVAGGEGG